MNHSPLFSTLIHRADLPSGGLLDDLLEAVWMIEEGDEAGHAWCEQEGYPGYTSYASLDDLPQRAPAFEALVTTLDQYAAACARAGFVRIRTPRTRRRFLTSVVTAIAP